MLTKIVSRGLIAANGGNDGMGQRRYWLFLKIKTHNSMSVPKITRRKRNYYLNGKFVGELRKDDHAILKRRVIKFMKTNSMDIELTRKERYIKLVFGRYEAIISSLFQISLIPVFLSYYPIPKFFLQHLNEPSDFYRYHYENYFIRVASLLDLCLHLLNEVFDLGISVKSVSEKTVLENHHVKNSATHVALVKLMREISSIKQKRNLIVHQGKLEIDIFKEFREFGVKTIIKHMEMRKYTSFNVNLPREEHQKIILLVKEIRSEYRKFEILLAEIFESLFDNYEKRKSSLM